MCIKLVFLEQTLVFSYVCECFLFYLCLRAFAIAFGNMQEQIYATCLCIYFTKCYSSSRVHFMDQTFGLDRDFAFAFAFAKEGGSLRDRVTGEVIPLERRGSRYSLRMWVRQDPGVNSNSRFAWPV